MLVRLVTNTLKMKYVLYFRVSTKKQGESGLGLESQRAILAHYISSDIIVEEYTDVESGSVFERSGLQKAIKSCVINGYHLAIAKVDRLSRNTKHTLDIFERLNGKLFFADLPISNDDPSAFKMLLTFHSAIAERERELIKIRTRHALKAKRDRGQKILGSPQNLTPEGRKKAWRKRIRIGDQNPNNIKLMNYIATLVNEGMSLSNIAKQLNNEGQSTPSGKRYSKFYPTTVKRIYERSKKIKSNKLKDSLLMV